MSDPLYMDDDAFARWIAIEREKSEQREGYVWRVAQDRADLLEALSWCMGTLAGNLEIAGALCASYWLGSSPEMDPWHPGCGRSAT